VTRHHTPQHGAGQSTGPAQKDSSFEQQARDVADGVSREAGKVADQARELVDQAVEGATEAAEEAKQRARDAATQQKDLAAERIGHYAHALKTASDDLRGHGQDFAAQSIEYAADGLGRASNVMRERDLDQLLGTVEDFARRQPVAFFGSAVALGFGVSRLLKSSAERRRQSAVGNSPAHPTFGTESVSTGTTASTPPPGAAPGGAGSGRMS
jgi:ElaB/YqjD/DUF883 family membrane-anchored ribosome-binding protein